MHGTHARVGCGCPFLPGLGPLPGIIPALGSGLNFPLADEGIGPNIEKLSYGATYGFSGVNFAEKDT